MSAHEAHTEQVVTDLHDLAEAAERVARHLQNGLACLPGPRPIGAGDEPPESRSMPEPLLTTDDMAARFNCSPSTVRRRAKAGDLPEPIRWRGLTRWHPGAVDAWLEERAP